MPELPDIVVYIESLERRVMHHTLLRVRIGNPFVLRSVDPPMSDVEGRNLVRIERLGKRIALGFDNDLFLVLHLMIAGRLHWEKPGKALPGKRGLLALDFATGTVVLTEAGTKRRASIHVVRGNAGLLALDRGGLEVLAASAESFRRRIRQENHTLKRSLTDPRLFSGIGNAYSDEILHRAGLSPLKLTARLQDEEIDRLYAAVQSTLTEWIQRLRAETDDGFPERVTAFRPEMAVHGRYRQPCPTCGTPVQRIVYAENECNYCPTCQTEGRLLADRAMSRLLKEDWPRSLDDWDAHIEERRRV